MNCKPGDLAVVVKTKLGFEQYIGRIVTVLKWEDDVWQWEIDLQLDGRNVYCADSALRPIRDQPGADEMLLITGLPERNGVAA